jgi:hypothetical protein
MRRKIMASVRFFGREIPVGSNRPEDRQRDTAQGNLIKEMTDAALPQTVANQRELQRAQAAQTKQLRDEARAIAKQFNIEVTDEQ